MDALRRHRLDGFLVALAVAVGIGLALSDNTHRYLAAGIGAAAPLALLARRYQPLGATGAALALLAGALAAAPNSPNVQFFALMALFAVGAAINTTRDGVLAWAAGAGFVAVATFLAGTETKVADYLLTLAFCTVMWVAGWLVSRHIRRADLMALRAHGAEQERVIAVQSERSRIARELHDVVSHGLSVVVLQTVAARAAAGDADLAEVDRHLDAVETSARDALGEMRRMLGLLQVDDLDAPQTAAPSPAIRELPVLVERARTAGVAIDCSAPQTGAPLSAGIELAVYRVVQEALTNVVKHAPGSSARVLVRVTADEVTVDVTNSRGTGAAPGARPAGARYGLIGMRERVSVYAGTLTAGPTPDGGFSVHATLPVETASSTAPVAAPHA